MLLIDETEIPTQHEQVLQLGQGSFGNVQHAGMICVEKPLPMLRQAQHEGIPSSISFDSSARPELLSPKVCAWRADSQNFLSSRGFAGNGAQFPLVIPAKAGIQIRAPRPAWIPAFAGMTDPPTGLLVQSPFQKRELRLRALARAKPVEGR